MRTPLAPASHGPPTTVVRTAILVAEDDHDLREIVIGFLEVRGYRVVALARGAEPLARVWLAQFRVAVLDVRSPTSVAFKLLAELRATDPTLPVIVITSFGDELVSCRARRMAATTVIEKPLDLEDLARAIEKAS